MVRFATEVVSSVAVQRIDVGWWRELVALLDGRPDRLNERVFRRPDRWDEDAAVEILEELAGIGGYGPAKLAVQLVRIGGEHTRWAPPWRARLEELRAGDDADIREMATAVRIP